MTRTYNGRDAWRRVAEWRGCKVLDDNTRGQCKDCGQEVVQLLLDGWPGSGVTQNSGRTAVRVDFDGEEHVCRPA